MDASDEQNEETFDGVLDSIRQGAEKVLQGAEALDPDGLIADLAEHTTALANLTARETAAAEKLAQDKAVESKDLAAVLNCVIKRLVVGVGSPVLLRTELAADLPPVSGDGQAVAQMTERAMRAAILHAGDGGYVHVVTRWDDDCVVFEVAAEPGFEGSEQAASVPDTNLVALAIDADGQLSMAVDSAQTLNLSVVMRPASVH